MALGLVYERLEDLLKRYEWAGSGCEATLSCLRLQRRLAVRISGAGREMTTSSQRKQPIDITEPGLAQQLMTNKRLAMEHGCIKLTVAPMQGPGAAAWTLVSRVFADFREAVSEAGYKGCCRLWLNLVRPGGERWSAWYLSDRDEWWADVCNPGTSKDDQAMLATVCMVCGGCKACLGVDQAWDRHMKGLYRPHV